MRPRENSSAGTGVYGVRRGGDCSGACQPTVLCGHATGSLVRMRA